MSRIAVVILNWNGKKYLEKFIPPLIEYTRDDADIIVADNASSDDSVAFLTQHYPQIRIIRHQTNWGFARGYNEALKQIDATYYILLNSDIEVTPNWILPIIQCMDSDPSVAVCQPKIRSYSEPNNFEYAGAGGGFIDQYGYPFCQGRIFLSMEEDVGQYDEPREIFWASGACFFVRATTFLQLGGFDEDFFAHMEEIDFCWRLHNTGNRVMVCPASTVFHIGGGTLPKISWKKTYLNFRNNFMLLYKNLPPHLLWKIFIVRLIMDGIAAFKFLFQAGFKDFWAVVKAHHSFFIRLPALRKKRKMIPHGSMKNIYRRNIVFDYYILGKRTFSELPQDKFFSE